MLLGAFQPPKRAPGGLATVFPGMRNPQQIVFSGSVVEKLEAAWAR
jgi:hypothetical protein